MSIDVIGRAMMTIRALALVAATRHPLAVDFDIDTEPVNNGLDQVSDRFDDAIEPIDDVPGVLTTIATKLTAYRDGPALMGLCLATIAA